MNRLLRSPRNLPVILLMFLAASSLLHAQDRSSPTRSNGSGTEWLNPFVTAPSVASADSVPDGTNENWRTSFGVAGTDGIVRAIDHVGSELYIGGVFDRIGGMGIHHIGMFDGTNWEPLGDSRFNGVDGPVYAILIDGDNVYVGGQFQNAAGKPARNIAVWNRRTGEWSTLGKGMGGVASSAVYSIVRYRGEIYAAGRFVVAGTTVSVNIARWDGTKWNRVGTGINNIVFTLAIDQDYLYAAGGFTVAGDVRTPKIARFVGAENRWEGIPNTDFAPTDAVRSIAFDQKYIYVAGRFASVSGRPANNIARMEKASGAWSDMDGGITNSRHESSLALTIDEDGLAPVVINAIAIRGEDLIAGGNFDNLVSDPRMSGDDAMNSPRDIANWNTRTEKWSMFPRKSAISGITYPSSGLMKGSVQSSSAQDLNKTIVRDDQSTEVHVLEPGEGDGIYIGGSFDMAGSFVVKCDACVEANRILPDPESAYTGNVCLLSQKDTLWSPIGEKGIDDNILDIAVNGAEIYSVGKFRRAGGTIVNNVARYNQTTGAWSGFGSGLGGLESNGGGYAVAVQGNTLYVGGLFQTAGGIPSRNIARVDLTSGTWSTMGTPPFSVVRDIRIMGNDIVAVGDTAVGFWNGSSWDMAPSPPNGRIYSAAVWGDTLFVGGKFSMAGGKSASNIALYNRITRTWFPLKEGVNDTVYTLEIWNGNLFVGGNYTQAGGRYAIDLASWDIDVDLWDVVNSTGIVGTTQRTQSIHSLKVGRYGLYIGGDFQTSAQSKVTSRANSIALWDGSVLRGLGNGVIKIITNGSDPGSSPMATIYALDVTDSSLVVAGDFQYAGAKSSNRFAEWVYPVNDPNGGNELDGGVIPTSIAAAGTTYNGPNIRLREIAAQQEWLDRIAADDGAVHSSGANAFAPHPDDQYWDDRFGASNQVPGTNDEIFAMATDGTNVYMGGVFTKAAGIDANSIVLWNGADWETLDNGIANGINGFVFDILVDGDKVYAAGQFSKAGGVNASNIAVWDKADRTWSPLGGGVAGDGTTVPFISAMTFYNGELYVGGNFTTAGGTSARNIAKWNGSNWVAVGPGIDGTVNALRIFEGKLFIGGTFGRAGSITANGFAWYENGIYRTTPGFNGYVNDFDVMDKRLLVGGRFDILNRKRNLTAWKTDTVINYDVTINGNDTIYTPRDTTLTHNFAPVAAQADELDEIRDLVVDEAKSRIYVGGSFNFTPEPALSSQKFAQPAIRNFGFNFQDHGWRDTGLTGFTPWFSLATGTDGPVNAMAIVGEEIFVGGSFTSAGVAENRATVLNVARVNTRLRNWSALISGRTLGNISAMTLFNGQLYAAGPFTEKSNPTQRVDEENQIAYLGTAGWSRQTGSMNGGAYVAATVGEKILVGGQFFTSDEKIGVNLSQFDPATRTWSALSPGSGVASQVEISYVNAVVANDRYIYVGGYFGVVDTFETPYIARYDRQTGEWSPLGTGLDQEVWALALAPDGTLYAGGDFRFAGSTEVRRVARWDGSSWQPLGSGIEGNVRALVFGDGRLYVGGTITKAGDLSVNNIATYNPDQNVWEGLGQGLSSSFLPSVNALAWHKGNLYVGGFFQRSGSDTMMNVARWRDGRWWRLGSGTTHAVWAVVPDREQVYFAGAFGEAGGKPSPYVALWHDPVLSVDEVAPTDYFAFLRGVGPNPFSEETTIRFLIPAAGEVSIEICDLRGVVVAKLLDGRAEAGEHRIGWQPADQIPAGLYFCRMTYNGEELVERIIRQ